MINKLKQHRKFRDFLTQLRILTNSCLSNALKQDRTLLKIYVDYNQVPSSGVFYNMKGHLSWDLSQPFVCQNHKPFKNGKNQIKTDGSQGQVQSKYRVIRLYFVQRQIRMGFKVSVSKLLGFRCCMVTGTTRS